MAQELKSLIDKHVSVITNDGKNLVGILAGIDGVTNVVLKESVERIFSVDDPVRQVPIGLYIVRGDNIAVIGEMDEELDGKTDFDSIRVNPIKPVKH